MNRNGRVAQVLLPVLMSDGNKIIVHSAEGWKELSSKLKKASNSYLKRHSSSTTYMGLKLTKPEVFPCVYHLEEVTHNIHQFDDHSSLREWKIEGKVLFDKIDVKWFLKYCPSVLDNTKQNK